MIVNVILLFFISSGFSQPVEPIIHSPGIYFDPTSIAYFYNDYWNVITHLEFIPVKPYLDKIQSSTQSIAMFCDKAEKIARKYDDAILTCQQNEKEIFSLMKDNIHVVQSTINNFKLSVQKLNENEMKVKNQIEKLNNIFMESAKINTKLINIEKINSMFNVIESSLLSISNILDTILNSILFAKVNILHPYVIAPTKLYEELSNSIQTKRNSEFPIYLSLQNIHTIIDLSSLQSYFYNNKLVFVIQIPLINPTKFNVYKNLPLPTPRKQNYQTYVLIHPSKLYVAVTDDRLSYALLDSMNECKQVKNEYIICPLPSILSTINNPTCETKLLTEVTLSLPEQCDYKLIYGNIDVWQKLKDGRYIYVQSKSNKLTMKCNNHISDYVLQGTGILSLESDCVAYFQTLQFYPSRNYSSVLPSQLSINYDIIQDDCCKYNFVNETSYKLSPITLSNINLESLKLASHKLDSLEHEINQNENQIHIVKYGNYYSAFSIVTMSFIFTYIVYKVYKNCFCKSTSASCCIQIYNQCYNKKTKDSQTKVHSSIELTVVKDQMECDRTSVKSLPEIEINKNQNKVVLRQFEGSTRNLSNF